MLSTVMLLSVTACSGGSSEHQEESTKAPYTEALPEETDIKPGDISVTWDDSHVYTGTNLDEYETIATYAVKGYEDIPFITVSDYMRVVFEDAADLDIEDGMMKITMNDTESTINPEDDTIYFENTARFSSKGAVDGAICAKDEFGFITPSVKNKSTQTKAAPLTISLKEYHLPVFSIEDDILMPFMALQNTYGGITAKNILAYNGKDYYNMQEAYEEPETDKKGNIKLSPYMKAAMSGPFSKLKETSKAYASYGYHAACLLLDLTYGHKEEKNIKSFDEFFTRINARNSLTSTRPETALTAEVLVFNYLFDSGHDSIVSLKTVFGDMDAKVEEETNEVVEDIRKSDEGKDVFEKKDKEDSTDEMSDEDAEDIADVFIGALTEKGFNIPESAPMLMWSTYFDSIKPKDYGDERLDYSGDTAVIYFNAFKFDAERESDYYDSPITKEDWNKSNFAFFHDCFKDIKKHKEIKNVVINLCDNGGGNASGLISILGFLSKDGEAKLTVLDMLADSYKEEYYHVDTNLDGKADDQDGYGKDYDFFIMTSGASYSCGTALPYFAQKDKMAKVIGTKPGGGDCVVGYFVDAYGYCSAYSDFLKLGTRGKKGFVSDEKATKVDFDMMPSIFDIVNVPWYDPDGIADAVHQYKDGKKEYVNKSKDKEVPDFLKDLLK